ncbi:MAG: hypothetical protein CMC78_02430 [Flavobacteriaceae bacterium]|nr:hypothetical protein [Flavobacteriaceae bacterium]
MELPTLLLPDAYDFPNFEFELPIGEIPQYTPLVVPPSDLRAPEGVKSQVVDKSKTKKEANTNQTAGIKQIDIPIIDVRMPVPESEILITAGTTAVISVAATLTATAVFKWLVTAMKPILKTTWKKIRQPKKKVS